jgi:hypothetical protein
MPDEPHAAPNPSTSRPIIDSATFAFLTNRPLDRITRNAYFGGDVDQLVERETTIGGIINKIVEARGDVDDVSHFVSREPPLLLLRIHVGKCTRLGRSVLREIDVDNVEVGQLNGAIPGPQMGRSFLVAGNAGPG